ncbi:MAG: hypothetical protein FJ218_07155 [Ignavibacteria bacterium]|nr:hypothetical protein [Ignavibacteria bacterium]
MAHLTDIQLETYFLARGEFSPKEILSLENHVSECYSCKKNFEQLSNFYAELDEQLQLAPTKDEEQLARELFSKQIPQQRLLEVPKDKIEVFRGYAEVVVPKKTFLVRLKEFAFEHPIQFGGSASFAFGLLAVLFYVVKPMPKDINPDYAKVENNVLTVYNKKRDTLWQKTIFGLQDGNSMESFTFYNERLIATGDIDNDGRNEVLVRGTVDNTDLCQDTVSCFNSQGFLRWTAGMGKTVAFGDKSFTAFARWRIDQILLLYNEELQRNQIFVATNSELYFPGKLLEISSLDGKELQCFWNSGSVSFIFPITESASGKQRLLITGINNSYASVYVSVLEPTHFYGAAPATKAYYPAEIPEGNALFYILLPPTKLNALTSFNPYNTPEKIFYGKKGHFILYLHEGNEKLGPFGFLYTLNDKMQLVDIAPGDQTLATFKRLTEEKRIHFALDTHFWNEVKNSLRYWDGEKFISEPTMNKKYLERIKQPL